MSKTSKTYRPKEFVAGKHYYFDNGLMVFTELYHQERGYCCESGCRHCPYGFKNQKNENKKTE